MDNTDKAIQTWLNDWKKTNLLPEEIKLISQANFDLYHGPVRNGSFGDPTEGDNDWDNYPGFSIACEKISTALDKLPSDVWVNDDDGEVVENEPDMYESCFVCDGSGKIPEESGEAFNCDACQGSGSVEEVPFTWWHYTKTYIVRALVGKELSPYM